MTLDEFKNGIDWLMSNPDGCVSFKVGKTPEGKDVAIVLGFVGGYDEDADDYQITVGEELLTMCGKVAVNIDDLQCDYDFDWYMPWSEDGDVYDTETSIGKSAGRTYDYLLNEAKFVLSELENSNLTVEK